VTIYFYYCLILNLLKRTRQLIALLSSLLPGRADKFELASELEDILEDDANEVSLTKLRNISIMNGRHSHSWTERSPLDTFSVGDYGYLPDGGKDFTNFKVLGNVFDTSDQEKCTLERSKELDGSRMKWVNRFPQRTQTKPYLLPDELEG
jgi:hypothetical protein